MKKLLACILSISLGIVIASSCFASGHPMIAADSSNDLLVVGKFHQNNFSLAQAEQMVSMLSGQLGLLEDDSTTILTPGQIAAMFGISDADVLKAAAKNEYYTYGFDTYIFLDITRVSPVSQVLGPNIRIDAWIADMTAVMGVPGEYLYLGSLEIPEIYLTQINQLPIF